MDSTMIDHFARFRQIGETIICPHQDGDYELIVRDLENWSTGSCLISQIGQGDKEEIIVTREEAGRLAVVLEAFARGS